MNRRGFLVSLLASAAVPLLPAPVAAPAEFGWVVAGYDVHGNYVTEHISPRETGRVNFKVVERIWQE